MKKALIWIVIILAIVFFLGVVQVSRYFISGQSQEGTDIPEGEITIILH